MPLARIRVYLDATGPQSVLVNGEDVVDRVAEVGLKASPGQPPELWLMHRGELDLEGDGIVKVALVEQGAVSASDSDVICEFLDSIDPAELETRALESLGLGDAGGTQAMLDQLKRWARGQS